MRRSYGTLIVFLIIGAILGGIIGDLLSGVDALASVMPILVHTYPVLEMTPATLNLYVIQVTLGLSFTPNLMSIIGMVVAIILFRRY
ncbi:hypothetical protein D081_0078 [Anaerovibrio sp. JC8]|uniref:DUF4321 domain-containing protein n=1 Tax=Anaerovibrio sp. JC8 TaxID=1240085 RepID=UPI000A0B736B|nr:DUF4321 domain-containing protein [Anaerovibrio sp. JC8]ORU01259.1 hypothetical protein D081_0078 [Anaerovibrio sp. JC8]